MGTEEAMGMSDGTSPVGLVLGSLLPPEELTAAARAGEQLGFGQLWMAEDCFFAGAVSSAAVVLGATERIPVGLGIVNAMVRHPALLAMELSTIGRIHPGRIVPAIGLGLPVWLRQLGLHPASPLAALRDCVGSVRRLLDGEEVGESGANWTFDRVQLSFPAAMPLYMGIMGPKMLELSGEIADGTVLSVLASAGYVAWARERIAAGTARGGRAGHHRISTFALFAVDDDGERAREQMRPFLAFFLETVSASTLVTALGIADELRELMAAGPGTVEREMPASWLEDLAVAGDPGECAAKIRRLLEAGSDTVELFPRPARARRRLHRARRRARAAARRDRAAGVRLHHAHRRPGARRRGAAAVPPRLGDEPSRSGSGRSPSWRPAAAASWCVPPPARPRPLAEAAPRLRLRRPLRRAGSAELLEALDLDDVTLVGWSMAGAVGARVARASRADRRDWRWSARRRG